MLYVAITIMLFLSPTSIVRDRTASITSLSFPLKDRDTKIFTLQEHSNPSVIPPINVIATPSPPSSPLIHLKPHPSLSRHKLKGV